MHHEFLLACLGSFYHFLFGDLESKRAENVKVSRRTDLGMRQMSHIQSTDRGYRDARAKLGGQTGEYEWVSPSVPTLEAMP
jgi:hypothetical protein